jgi:hypothetical protein
MFSNPSLLRQLTLTAEQLRRGGEGAWARRLVQTADQIRKIGWTDDAQKELTGLFEADPGLESVTFGAEHERRLNGPAGVSAANIRLSELRLVIRELAAHPTKQGPPPGEARKRSPDLA